MKLLVTLSALLLAAHAHAYKILCIFSFPSHSHNTLAKGIVDALLKSGHHEVTWATPFPEMAKSEPNLQIIDLSATQELGKVLDQMKEPIDQAFTDEFAKNISEAVASTKALRDIIVKQQFDAVVTQWFFFDGDAGYAAVQQVPWIALSGMVMRPHLEDLVDEVRSITTVPMMMLTNQASMPMNFWQRVSNVVMYSLIWFDELMKQSAVANRYEQLFGPLAAARGLTLPPFAEAKHNISVLLVNSHPSISTAQVLPANVVYIAGYHFSEAADPLPKDLQYILDSSNQGVIYFSMGSIMKSTMLQENTRKGLVQMFKELPYTVLWKFEEVPPGLSKNVHVRPWFPQGSVLAHPNVKLFITHGGQLSTLEAIHYGIPILAIPVYGDQHSNAATAVRSGYAKMVPYSKHMMPELRVALKEMLADDRYYKKAKFMSKLFKMRPVPPSQLISHYVELAIESKGAYHLRSPSQLYAWYERWMLDFIALLLLLLYFIKFVVNRLYRTLFSIKDAKNKPQDKVKMN